MFYNAGTRKAGRRKRGKISRKRKKRQRENGSGNMMQQRGFSRADRPAGEKKKEIQIKAYPVFEGKKERKNGGRKEKEGDR